MTCSTHAPFRPNKVEKQCEGTLSHQWFGCICRQRMVAVVSASRTNVRLALRPMPRASVARLKYIARVRELSRRPP